MTQIMQKFENLLKEKYESEHIRYRNETLIIYGAGNLGRATLKLLNELNLKCVFFCDKNEKLKDTLIDGFEVKHPAYINDKFKKESIVLVSVVAVAFKEIKKYLNTIGFEKIYFSGDFLYNFVDKPLLNVWYLSELSNDEKNMLVMNFNIFNDYKSKIAYYQNTEWFLKHTDAEESYPVFSQDDKYFIEEIRKHFSENDIWIDTAYLNGEYIEKIRKYTENSYTYIYSFKLMKESDPPYEDSELKIKVINYELGNEDGCIINQGIATMLPFATIQEYFTNTKIFDEINFIDRFNFFRCYSMNEAINILKGSIKSIKLNRPIIMCNIGHYKKDFINVPYYLNKHLENYTFIFRNHGYYANDSIIYAIPKEKLIEKV